MRTQTRIMRPDFQTKQLVQARKLLARRNLWNLKKDMPGGTASAIVQGQRAEPYLVIWDGESWSCECDNSSKRLPCVHLAALLLQLGVIDQISLGPAKPDGVKELDSTEHLLFFTSPKTIETIPVAVLGPSKTVEDKLSRPPLHSNDPGGVTFKGIDKSPWSIVPGRARHKTDTLYGRPIAQKSFVGMNHRGQMSASIAGGFLLQLFKTGMPLLDINGKRWQILDGGKIHIRFLPLLTPADTSPCFEPQIYGFCENTVFPQPIKGSLIPANDAILLLNEEHNIILLIDHCRPFLWLLRLVLSRKVLRHQDIKSLIDRKGQDIPAIIIEAPKQPDTPVEDIPVLVLDIAECKEYTTLLPRFLYQGIEADQYSNRNIAAEESLLKQCEDMLINDLAWQRGHYSGITGTKTMPLHINRTFAEVLQRYARPLMDANVVIRLENRPILPAAGMNIRAENTDLRLNLTVQIEDKSGHLADLDINSLMEEGLVRTREAYFILDRKSLIQLDFLQKKGMNHRGFLSTSPNNISLIDALYGQFNTDLDTIRQIKKKRAVLHRISDGKINLKLPVPGAFKGKLRPYQLQGYNWLLQMYKAELGVCLADDMGLGKTIQTLAYLCRLKTKGKLGQSLLVLPIITLENWMLEMKRFTPMLKAHVYNGPSHKRFVPPADQADIVIVSYQTLRNDAVHFLDRAWDHLILDEAHYVKNSTSQIFKTVSIIKSAHRISLTGTPLENHLGELWAQMSFLNPGLLGSKSDFDRLHSNNLAPEEALQQLRQTVKPFILRRTREQVLDDLPPREVIILRCGMSPEQEKAYKAMSKLYHFQISGLLSSQGLAASKIQILSILTKLRLLAIYPPLAGKQFKDIRSDKMDFLNTLLGEVLEENNKSLVFSQFLGSLDCVAKTCQKNNWRYSRITGSTRDRQSQIDMFSQDPDIKIFLLSLRAGGVGINLTAADYVFLIDPWWNPAVEDQAISRTHRMGRTKPVIAYKLITTGTIEEKVLELQQKKLNLIEGVLEGSQERQIPTLSESEILELLE